MPTISAFNAAAGASACCFASHYRDASLAQNPCIVYGNKLHRIYASEHPFLAPFYNKFESDVDYALLLAQLEQRTPFGAYGGQLMFEPYYKQLGGTAALTASPFGLGALLATKSLKLVLDASSLTARPAFLPLPSARRASLPRVR